MSVQLKRFEFNREKNVLINLVLNTEFCGKILPVIRDDYFNSQYASTLIKWVRNYYELYSIAPKGHINEIFEEYGHKLDPDVHSQIGSILQHLSDVMDTEVHNIDYLIDTANDLFREKHLELQNKVIKEKLEKGDIIGAENALLEQYQGIKDLDDSFTSFDDEDFIRECIREIVVQQEPETAFFMFSGKLGEFIGPINRGWFVAYLAPAKRGKTTYMLDAAIDSIRQGLNTVVISLEMPKSQLMQRYVMAVTGAKPELGGYTVMVPTMDCQLNQIGECEKEERSGAGTIQTDEGVSSYEDNPDWITCTACRGTTEFIPSAWKVPVEKEYISESKYFRKVQNFNKYFGKYGRIVHMPSKTVTVDDIRQEITYLENTQNFIPDVIIIDYADLIKPEMNTGQKRHDLDDIWEALRGWGQEKHVLIISASQTNRISADVEYLRDIHVAEDYSKIAKLDIAIGLCQTDQMKEMGMMNLNKVVHRHKEYVQSRVCTVLQELSHQQSTLDSEFIVK